MKYKTYTAIAALVSGMALFNCATAAADQSFTSTVETTGTDGKYVLVNSHGAVVPNPTGGAVGSDGTPAAGYSWRPATFADTVGASAAYKDGAGNFIYDVTVQKLLTGDGKCPTTSTCQTVTPGTPIAQIAPTLALPATDYTYETKAVTAKDVASGNSMKASANGATFSDGTGTKTTTVNANGLTTTGSIHATEGLYLGTYGGGATEIGSVITKHDGQIAALEGWRGIAQQQIASLQHDMKTVQGGVALALALDVPHLETGKRFGIAVNMADFEGTGAFAGGVALRLNETWQVNAGGGFGFNGGAAGGKVGIVGQW